MANFEVEIRKPADRQIRKRDPPVGRRILAGLHSLVSDPYPRGDTVARLKGHENRYRLRVGGYLQARWFLSGYHPPGSASRLPHTAAAIVNHLPHFQPVGRFSQPFAPEPELLEPESARPA